jgi:two-component system, OmpR family, phosphate regulon sensor histidine kinase PhoR
MSSFGALILRNIFIATALPLLVLALLLVRDQEQAGLRRLDDSLLVVASTTGRLLNQRPPTELQQALSAVEAVSGIRITIIDSEGTVLADNSLDPARADNHLDRPEVARALHVGEGRATRESATVNRELRYVALAWGTGPGRRVFRAAAPVERLRRQTRRTQQLLGVGVAAVLILAGLLGVHLNRRVVPPLAALSEAADRISAGDRHARVIPDGPGDIRRLGATFNRMVDRLNLQVQRLDETQGNLDAILAQMPDGLLVVDSRGEITRANPAAAALLGVDPEGLTKQPLLAVLLSYTLDLHVKQVLEGANRASLEVVAPSGKSLRVAIGPLVVGQRPRGALMILQDVSELRRADDMRRDFVANVSHELRTPVAAVRALVETLMLRREGRPDLIDEYGARIVGECERIDRLVEDLLLLAQTEAGRLVMQHEPLHPGEVVDEVLRQVEPLATGTGTALQREAVPEVLVLADRFALAQCLRNLVENGLRYASGGSIRVGGRVDASQLVLYVADDGPGIPVEDLPRIFERFYRVDKARGRSTGGSGLGLSIVRHLAEAQGGRVWVESQIGKGSTFYLAFPVLSEASTPTLPA